MPEGSGKRSRSLGNQWQRQMAAVPLAEVEDSILLRVLVQALVVVGIVATDVAAETQNSLWGVPLRGCMKSRKFSRKAHTA